MLRLVLISLVLGVLLPSTLGAGKALVYMTRLDLYVSSKSPDKEFTDLIKFSRPDITDKSEELNENSVLVTLSANKPSKEKNVSISSFTLELTLNKTKMGYWKIGEASITLDGSVKMNQRKMLNSASFEAPLDLSYHCSNFGPLIAFQEESGEKGREFYAKIYIKGFQMQAFTDDNTKFRPAYECVGFFTIGIWSGIFITLILMAIMTWGIAMVMNIKTMDRFDDPKGKPVLLGGGSDQ